MVNKAQAPVRNTKKYQPREEPPGDTEDRQDKETEERARLERDDDRGRQKPAARNGRARPARPR